MFADNVSITRALCRWLDSLDAAALPEAASSPATAPMLAEIVRCLPSPA